MTAAEKFGQVWGTKRRSSKDLNGEGRGLKNPNLKKDTSSGGGTRTQNALRLVFLGGESQKKMESSEGWLFIVI